MYETAQQEENDRLANDALRKLRFALIALKRYPEAIRYQLKYLEHLQRRYNKNSLHKQDDFIIADNLSSLSDLYLRDGEFEKAVEYFRDALRTFQHLQAEEIEKNKDMGNMSIHPAVLYNTIWICSVVRAVIVGVFSGLVVAGLLFARYTKERLYFCIFSLIQCICIYCLLFHVFIKPDDTWIIDFMVDWMNKIHNKEFNQ